MSSPPDFLGLALGMLRQQQQAREGRLQQQRQAQAMQMERDRFELMMRREDDARRSEAFNASHALIQGGVDAKAVFAKFGDLLREGDRAILTDQAKVVKEAQKRAESTPSEAGQADIATGAAAVMGQEQDPLRAAIAGLRAIPESIPPALGNQLASRAGGIAAENQRQRTEFEGRTRFGTQENIRQARAVDQIGAASERGNYRFPDGSVVTARNRAEANKFVQQGGVWIGASAGIGLTGADLAPAATQAKLFERLEAIGEQRRMMDRIAENYDPRYLELFGQGEAAVTRAAEKLGMSTSQDKQDFLAGYNSFKADLGNNLMAKIQERAATTFTDRLYDRMRKWNLTEDLSDPEFRRLYREIKTELDLNYARTIFAIKHDPLVAAEAEEKGELSMQTRNRLEGRYPNERMQKMMRSTEQRAVAGAVRSGASDAEAMEAGVRAVEETYFQPGAQ